MTEWLTHIDPHTHTGLHTRYIRNLESVFDCVPQKIFDLRMSKQNEDALLNSVQAISKWKRHITRINVNGFNILYPLMSHIEISWCTGPICLVTHLKLASDVINLAQQKYWTQQQRLAMHWPVFVFFFSTAPASAIKRLNQHKMLLTQLNSVSIYQRYQYMGAAQGCGG